jgi:hypothetical protein
MKKLFLTCALAFSLTGCSYSIIMNHTEGQASDVVDETQSTPVTTTANIPLAPLK